MELRSFNVIRVYKECVKCRIGIDLGVNKVALEIHKEDIKDMLSQIRKENNTCRLGLCNERNDGEYWTPYLQIVEMLILMGQKLGLVEFGNKLEKDTIIKFL